MYGDLVVDWLGVNFLCRAPIHLELLHMLSTFGQHCWVVVLPSCLEAGQAQADNTVTRTTTQ